MPQGEGNDTERDAKRPAQGETRDGTEDALEDENLRVFEEAMRDVQRLEDPGAPAKVVVRRQRVQRSLEEVGEPVRFQIEQWGEPPNQHWEAVAPGVGRPTIRRLRRGKVPIARTLDLHGMDASAARDAVAETLQRMWELRERGLLIIHGRGLHSEAGPVLKESLPEWLAAPPHGRRILAFLTAPPELGGAGATLVLVRKRRKR
jgi:DNA-nicking Smr family endonuclease